MKHSMKVKIFIISIKEIFVNKKLDNLREMCFTFFVRIMQEVLI